MSSAKNITMLRLIILCLVVCISLPTLLANDRSLLTDTLKSVSGSHSENLSDTLAHSTPVATVRRDYKAGKLFAGNTLVAPENIANGPMRSEAISIQFRSTSNSCAKAFQMWWRYATPDSVSGGYSSGDGGKYKIEIQTDMKGSPSGEILDTVYFLPDIDNYPNVPVTSNAMREVDLGSTACFQVGHYYHVVLTNVHPYPEENYVSFNGPYLRDTTQNFKEAYSCKFCVNPRILRLEQNGLWMPYPDRIEPTIIYQPYWCLGMQDGADLGQPFNYGHGVTNRPKISGNRKIRQRLRHSIGEDTSGILSFYGRKLRGNDKLRIAVNDSIVGTVSMTSYPGLPDNGQSFDWYSLELDSSVLAFPTLELVFETASTSEYEISSAVRVVSSRCGVDLNMQKAEFTENDGLDWSGLTVFGREDHPGVRFSVYLTEDHRN